MEEKVFNSKDLIKYQKDSVVSRMLINKKSGSVTLFAFDKKQKLSEHSAPFDALVQVLDGETEISISAKNYSLKQGDFIIMPANKPHAVTAVKKFKMMLTMIKS
ncbi:MAG: cupin domain-containing protein [Candidatus Thermoplasmatota archaeon]